MPINQMSLPFYCHSCGNVIEPDDSMKCPLCRSEFLEIYQEHQNIYDSMFESLNDIFTQNISSSRPRSFTQVTIVEDDTTNSNQTNLSNDIEENNANSYLTNITNDIDENDNSHEEENELIEYFSDIEDDFASENNPDDDIISLSQNSDYQFGNIANDIANLLNRIRTHRHNSNANSSVNHMSFYTTSQQNNTTNSSRGRNHENSSSRTSRINFIDYLRGIFRESPQSSTEENIGSDRRNYALGPEYEEILSRLFEEGKPKKNPAKKEFTDNLIKTHPKTPGKCSICLVEYKVKELGFAFKCGHFFHSDCMLEWLKMQNTCPVCRAVLEKM